jgi:flagellar protein FliO/FliZ
MELITGTQIVRLIAALALVLALMMGLNLFMRRLNNGGLQRPGQKRRLKVVESLVIDARRRLVLIRRDDREHLVILGPAGETVVESGIAAIESPNEEPTQQS